MQDVEVQELSSGTLLGHYKLTRRLGQGGMGVVWEANDQKLGRNVAVKLLTEATRDSKAALERFWREARAASSLNHPGICTIHELNESAETPFIVMELLEGQSLEKLYRGVTMPYPRLVEMGVQLADALDAAHRKGILHRDIKPANIFVTKSGQAKLLDFGLAKLEEASDSGTDGDAPTAVDPLTGSGSSVGTVAYMSPEQARGEVLDARSDVFSLGVVLYEVATGQPPFSGTTTAVVFDKILNHPPTAPVELNAELPVEFENILNKTLEKDRDLRCQSAAELRADLKRLQRKSSSGSVGGTPPSSGSAPSQLSGSGTSNPSQPAAGAGSSGAQAFSASGVIAPPKKSRGLVLGVASLVGLAAIGFAAWRFWPRAQPFEKIAVNQVTNAGNIENIALSADGRFLAEVKNDGGERTLWERNTATNTDTQILGAFGNQYVGLTFSPDSNYLYFTRGTPEDATLHALYMMPVFNGTPKQLVYDIDSPVSFGPDGNRFTYLRWTPDRKDQYSEIHIADKDGSNNQVILATKEDANAPVWSPDGGRIAWLGSVGQTTRYAVHILDIVSKKQTTIEAPADVSFQNSPTGGTSAVWTPDGAHLLLFYLKPHTDHAQIGVITVPSGEFHPVTNDVSSYSELALSADGRTLATVLTNIDSSIAYYKPEGGTPVSVVPLRITPNHIEWVDENRLLFSISRIALGTLDRTTGNVQNFDSGEINVAGGISTCPDGHILFTGFPKGAGQARIFRMDADGGNIAQLTTSGIARGPRCSADSQQAFYSLSAGGANVFGLWAVPVAGGTPRQVLPPAQTTLYQISNDGRLAATDIVEPIITRQKVFDLVSGRVLYASVADSSDLGKVRHFAPENRALVSTILRNGSRTLLYEPLDGSAPHTMMDPVQETIRDFCWSPSGKQLAVLRLKSSSDVVLITDQQGKSKN